MAERKAANQKMLSEADQTQDQTLAAVDRIKQQTAMTEELGAATLEELRAQGRQMDDINQDITAVNAKLDTAQGLQDRFDRWSGNIFGFKKRAANKEAASEIAERAREELQNIKEVFENEKYDMFSRTWKSAGMTLCNNPSQKAPELFDPNQQGNMTHGGTRWDIDFGFAGIDREGWTYAADFAYLNKHGAGTPDPAWNSKVRRRKWKYAEKTGNEVIDGVRSRNKDRVSQRQNAANGTDKVGTASRAAVSGMKQSGLTSTNRTSRNKEDELDDESKAGMNRLHQRDQEIDRGINDISRGLDTLAAIATNMKEETKSQNRKLEAISDNMDMAAEKQARVNARQRKFLS